MNSKKLDIHLLTQISPSHPAPAFSFRKGYSKVRMMASGTMKAANPEWENAIVVLPVPVYFTQLGAYEFAVHRPVTKWKPSSPHAPIEEHRIQMAKEGWRPLDTGIWCSYTNGTYPTRQHAAEEVYRIIAQKGFNHISGQLLKTIAKLSLDSVNTVMVDEHPAITYA